MTFQSVSTNGCISTILAYTGGSTIFTQDYGSNQVQNIRIDPYVLGEHTFTIEETANIDSNLKHLTTVIVEVICAPVFQADDIQDI